MSNFINLWMRKYLIRQELLLAQHLHQEPTVPWQNTGAILAL